jgi:hypothetical protein
MKKVQGQNTNWAEPNFPVGPALFKLADFPVFMGCVDNSFDPADDYVGDLQFGVCPVTGTIQSMNRMPAELVYLKPHNTCVGKTWSDHHNAFAGFILDRLSENAVVYEIGGGDGYLASKCIEYVKEWHIIEPNLPDTHFEHPKLTYHSGYYPDVPVDGADVVVHSNLLEHIRNPREFLADLEAPTQLFSVPHFDYAMMHGYPSILNFEHENGLTREVVIRLLTACGYEHMARNYKNFTWFYEAYKVAEAGKIPLCCNNVSAAYSLLITYRNSLVEHAVRLQKGIGQIDGNLYFFGAHIFYTMLRAFGLNAQFTALLDNSPLKIGKRLYGTDLMVFSPEVICDEVNPTVVVPRTPYQAEMVEQVKKINPGARIVC